MENGNINNVYARVSNDCSYSNYQGGLISIVYGGSISNAYSTGRVVGANGIGGLVGYVEGTPTCTNSYWDTQTSQISTSALCNDGGRTSAEMKTQSNYVGWDFDNIWNIQTGTNDGYPFFK